MKDELLAFLKQNKKRYSSNELLSFGSKKMVESYLNELKKDGLVDTYVNKSGYAVFKFFRYSSKVTTADQLVI